MVSAERNLASSFDIKTGKNVRWSTRLGTETHSTPIISGGRVFVGTNNGEPRDPRHQGDRGVLMCLDEKTGQFLWQLVVPKLEEDPYLDWPKTGMASTATVEGDRLYIVSNRGEVICLDTQGLSNGNEGPYLNEGQHMTPKGKAAMEPGPTDADMVWLYDLVGGVGIWPHDAAHSSILIHGNHLYVNTGTGVDNTHKKIRTPNAPSLVVIDKRSGKLLAKDDEKIAPNIFHSTWSSPSAASVNGRTRIFFGGGNGILYGFEPIPQDSTPEKVQSLKQIFRFDPDPSAPKENVHLYNTNRREGPSNIYSLPMFDQNRIYFTAGGDLWWGKNEAWVKCIDATLEGEISTNGLRWSRPLNKHSISTPVVQGGLVFVADTGRMVHCLDASNGKTLWTHEAKGEFWSSPLVADGKVFIGSRRNDFLIFEALRTKNVLADIELDSPVSSTATAANGTLFVATMFQLYAIQKSP
jgi:outer membrane protein assembly factor BamB